MKIDKFYKGQQYSKYFEGFESLKGVDVFNELGQARCFKQLTQIADTGAGGDIFVDYIDVFVFIFNCTDKAVYRYEYATDTMEKIATADDVVVSACAYATDVLEVYFSTDTKLYKIKDPTTATPTIENVGDYHPDTVFGQDRPRPMHVLGLDLYIGVDEKIAGVDRTGVYSDSVLDLQESAIITDLTGYGDDLLIGGTTKEGGYYHGFVMRYDTYSESFYARDLIDEKVNSLMQSTNNNIIFVSVGDNRDIYAYNGNTLQFYKSASKRGVTSTNYTETYPDDRKRAQIDGKLYFAFDDGIWTLHKRMRDETFCLMEQHPNMLAINGIESVKNYLLVLKNGVLYADNQSVRQPAELTTSLVYNKADHVRVGVVDLPTVTDIEIWTSSDNKPYVKQDTITDLTDENVVRTSNAIHNNRTLQVKVILTPVGDQTPVIDYIEIV